MVQVNLFAGLGQRHRYREWMDMKRDELEDWVNVYTLPCVK